MQIDLYTQDGNQKGTVDVSDAVFARKVDKSLIHRALVRQLANARQANAHTKTRGEVAGSTRKHHRQKGTGRARAGGIRMPHWRGGGVTFGPRNDRNYTQRMNTKERRAALLSALSAKAEEKMVLALEKYEGEVKTKPLAEMIKKMPIDRSALLILPEHNEVLEKSAANLPNVKTILATYLNIHDLLKYRHLVLVGEAPMVIETTFTK